MKYYIKTFGCQMNVHESEKLAGMLESLTYEKTETIDNADVIVFNTCCIRDGVEQKIMGNIGAIEKLKKKNPNIIVAICGCMSQADGRSDLIRKKFPFVDIIFGTHNIHKFRDFVIKFKENKNKITDIMESADGIYENIDIARDNMFSNAWVNINYGCNNFCSYCIVPYVRGRERSRAMEDIENEVKDLINKGYRYITLLGQNVNSYGNDIDNPDVNFANLLERLARLEGDFRIKFMTSHPKDLSEDVVKIIAKYEKLSKVIHLPIQSGNNKVLKTMNRKYTREHYLDLIDMIRKHIPDAYISTDIIVGFPGETEEEFMDTYTLIEKVRYDGVFAFMFSRRSGTVADTMPDQISEEIKKDRIHRLLKLSKDMTKQKNYELIGKTINVLSKEPNDYGYEVLSDSGRTINVSEKLEKNKFYKVEITKFSANKLYGRIINGEE